MDKTLYIIACMDDKMPVYACVADCPSEALNMAAIAHDMDFDDFEVNHYVSHMQTWDPSKFKTMSQNRSEIGEMHEEALRKAESKDAES